MLLAVYEAVSAKWYLLLHCCVSAGVMAMLSRHLTLRPRRENTEVSVRWNKGMNGTAQINAAASVCASVRALQLVWKSEGQCTTFAAVSMVAVQAASARAISAGSDRIGPVLKQHRQATSCYRPWLAIQAVHSSIHAACDVGTLTLKGDECPLLS